MRREGGEEGGRVYLQFFWLYFGLLTWSFSSNSKDLGIVLLFVIYRV